MGIYKRNNTYWCSFSVKGQRQQMSLRTSNKAEAAKMYKSVKSAAVNQALIERVAPDVARKDSQMTLLKGLERMIEETSWESKGRQAQHIKRLVAFNGADIAMNAIDAEWVVKVTQHLQTTGCSDSTINRYTQSLSTMLRRADRIWNVIDKVPVIEKRKEPEGRMFVFSVEDERMILDYFKPPIRDIVAFLIDTGLRVNEGLAMCTEVKRAPDAPECILIPGSITKTKKSRIVPMTARALDIYSRYEGRGGFGISYMILYRAWRRMVKALNLGDDAVLHCLRHTFCSRLVNAGVSLPIVQRLAGHTSLTTTQRYVHLSSHALADAIDKLPGAAHV